MNGFSSALWAEFLKARRSRVPFFSALGLSLAPLVGGLFMVILKDPERARSMGLIGAKAQITAGTAEWATFFNMQAQAVAIGGMIVFAIVTAWVFGREFSDRTVKELLALPTSREAIVAAKFVLISFWSFGLTLMVYALGLLVGTLVDIPGWSVALFVSSTIALFGAAALTIALLPYVAWLASAGRGYMSAFGWAILSVALAQIAAATGWGDWFPWAIPALFSGAAGPREALLGAHSFVILFLASVAGLLGTFRWWQSADYG